MVFETYIINETEDRDTLMNSIDFKNFNITTKYEILTFFAHHDGL